MLSLGPLRWGMWRRAHWALGEVLEARDGEVVVHMAAVCGFGGVSEVHGGGRKFLRPIKFAAAEWMGMNYELAKTVWGAGGGEAGGEGAVRSLSVQAWHVLGTLIELNSMPSSVNAAVRGTMGFGNSICGRTFRGRRR